MPDLTELQSPHILAVRPAGLAELANADMLMAAGKPPAGAYSLEGESESVIRPYEVANGVALIGVYGSLVSHAYWLGSRYYTGYNVLRIQLEHAFSDPEVLGIVFDIRSSGGYIDGLFDLVDWIVMRKQESGKPVAAICSEHAYSAAYALASAADTISVPRTGGVGSVGVVAVHWDYSKWLEKVGDKPTFIYSGKHKVEGNSFEPLPDQVKADWQKSFDEFRDLFADTVARNRTSAGRSLSKEAVLATEAGVYEGPVDTLAAVDLGFADAVLSPDAAFAGFAEFVSRTHAA